MAIGSWRSTHRWCEQDEMPPVSGADPFLTSTAPSTSENWPATLVRGSPLSAQDCDLLPPEAHRHIPSPRGPILGPTNRTQPNTTLSATPLRTLAALPTRPPKSHLTRGGEPDTDALRRVRQAVGGSAGAWAVPASAASSSSGQCAHSCDILVRSRRRSDHHHSLPVNSYDTQH
jgi:hypothetical protein